MQVSQVPSQASVDDINKAIPAFTADMSSLTSMPPEDVAQWAVSKSGEVVINISSASDDERLNLSRANEILIDQGELAISVFDSAEKENLITSGIVDELTDSQEAIYAFKELILKVVGFLDGNADLLVDEFNTFTTRANVGYEDLHYWNNMGLVDNNDGLRAEVQKFIDEVRAEFDWAFEENVLDELKEHDPISEKRDIVNSLILGMLSNMVRGSYYHYANPDKVEAYEPRKIAVDIMKRRKLIPN